jgi:hypothetical protein
MNMKIFGSHQAHFLLVYNDNWHIIKGVYDMTMTLLNQRLILLFDNLWIYHRDMC